MSTKDITVGVTGYFASALMLYPKSLTPLFKKYRPLPLSN